jgi:hypothetical protein
MLKQELCSCFNYVARFILFHLIPKEFKNPYHSFDSTRQRLAQKGNGPVQVG